MCGILVHVALDAGAGLAPEEMERLNLLHRHRGPDAGGVCARGDVTLGARRLAILDAPGGGQPMTTPDGRHTIVFNGEIYNHEELRADLVRRGHAPRTRSDTEVLLLTIAERGMAGLPLLNGAFAFAVWDQRERTLLVARDRMGEKPLYYAADRRRLFFSSELTPLVRSGLFPLDWDLASLDNYLAYWYVCEPRTVFEGISQLPPGHCATVRDGKLAVQRWWRIPARRATGMPLAEATRSLEGLLADAVRIRLRSDVPVGSFLSGGIDSGLVTAVAGEQGGGALEAFAVGFGERTYDELPLAGQTARKLGARLNAVRLQVTPELVESAVRAFDEPLGNASFLPLYELSRCAAAKVRVVLTGDGADELFGGYPTYQAPYYLSLWRRLPGGARALVRAGAARLAVTHDRISLDYRLKQLMKGIDRPAERAHYTWREVADPDLRGRLLRPEVLARLGGHDPFEVAAGYFAEAAAMSPKNRAMYVDLNTYLLNDHLRKVDRMTMASSLEARLPFLDHRIVEFAMQLPESHKVGLLTTKRILRRLAARRLPRAVLRGAKKGLTPPIAHWLVRDLREYLHDALQGGLVGEICVPQAVEALWLEHLQRRHDHSRVLWALAVLNLWAGGLRRAA